MSGDEKRELFGNLAAQDRLRHAYLFFGDTDAAGVFARELAVFLETGDWSGSKGTKSPSRSEGNLVPGRMQHKTLVDFLLIVPTDGSIGIDALREAHAFAYERPFASRRRTIVVSDAQLLTADAAANALKLTEEAPPATLIVFTAPQKEVLSPALASRLMPVYFPSDKQGLIDSRNQSGLIGFGNQSQAVQGAEPDLAEKLASLILTKYRENKKKNAPLVRELLRKQVELSRFNLNRKLQEKAIGYIMKTWT